MFLKLANDVGHQDFEGINTRRERCRLFEYLEINFYKKILPVLFSSNLEISCCQIIDRLNLSYLTSKVEQPACAAQMDGCCMTSLSHCPYLMRSVLTQ